MPVLKLFHYILNLIFPQPQQEVLDWNTCQKPDIQCSSYISSLFIYKDPQVQKAIWDLKYRGNKQSAYVFGELIYSTLLEKLSEEHIFTALENPILIPLPLSKQRKKERGWNQSALLCKAIIHFDLAHTLTYQDKVLIKVRHTNPQTKLSKKERLENLKDCFCINSNYKDSIIGRDIVLIDDVTTTGSTISEARNVLLKCGVRSVFAYTIAH
ncbi:MAG: hypothetical protein V4519_01030 [Patescibacteria group bacterium]